MSHTPGPWHCTLMAPSDEYCLVPWIDSPYHPGEQEWLESDADAHLIAAAPDLLAALEEIASPEWVTHVQAIDLARAAIAKAKGES